eukprot:g8028.t1
MALSSQYRKWDNFDDDDAVDEDAVPTRFDLGEGDLTPLDQCLVDSAHPARRLPRHEKVVWQVVVRPLRVWSASSKGAASGDDAVPCRPHCILVNNLYPSGQVMHREICDPPEEPPSARVVLELSLRLMLNPPDANVQQHRPERIVFPDKALANALAKSYAALGIECTQLSESEGVDEHVKQFSSYLVRKDVAARGDASEKPGLLATRGVTPPQCAALFAAAAEFARARPWAVLSERQVLKVSLRGGTDGADGADGAGGAGGKSVWVSVLGKEGGSPGIALFFHAFDSERRLLPAGARLARLELARPVCSASGRTEAQLGRKLKRTKPRMFDNRTGLELMFADAAAQRAHWKGVRRHARPLAERGVPAASPTAGASREPFWAEEECSALLEDPTVVPFDDHDAIRAHGWEVHGSLVPLPLTYACGEPRRPPAGHVAWLTRALAAVVATLRQAPRVLELRSETICLDNTKEGPKGADVSIRVGGEALAVVVRNATVLTWAEWQRATACSTSPSKSTEAPAPRDGADSAARDESDKDEEGESSSSTVRGRDAGQTTASVARSASGADGSDRARAGAGGETRGAGEVGEEGEAREASDGDGGKGCRVM